MKVQQLNTVIKIKLIKILAYFFGLDQVSVQDKIKENISFECENKFLAY